MLKWWQKTICYEIYPASFRDTTGSGTGDLRGIISRLDYLQKLGAGALWLTPVYASPMVDNGYDVSDYYAVNPLFGTMADMEELIAQAGVRGMKIVMDLVMNHTSDRHAWFAESRQSRDNPKADWYIWRDAKPGGGAPNNWRGIFGGSAWSWCEERQQYYLHTFAAAQPDLNWANPAVRQALFAVARFWAAKGAGGFRIDAVPYIKKPESLADGPADGADGLCSVHEMTANTPGILDYLREFKAALADCGDLFTVAEANGVPAAELPEWVGEHGVFDMLFEFSHVNIQFRRGEVWCRPCPWTLREWKAALDDSQRMTARDGWYPVFFENHDQPRAVSHYFEKDADPVMAAKLMAVLNLTLRGTPFVYQGQELGLANADWQHIDELNDLQSRSQYEFALREGCTEAQAMEAVRRFSRDNARTPMQWDSSPCAGFTSAAAPWLPVHGDYKAQNAAAEEAEKDSVLNFYRALSRLRQAYPVLTEGNYADLLPGDDKLYVFRRETEDELLTVLLNFGREAAACAPALTAGQICLLHSGERTPCGALQPLQCAVFYRKKC